MNNVPTIVIDKELLIRQPKKSDIDERFSLGRSLEYRQMVGGSIKDLPVYEYDNAVRLYEREMKNKYSWFIEYKGKMIGVCRLRLQDTGAVRYSIGIYDDSLFSKGIGTKVTKAVTEFAFDTLKLKELELMVLEYNKRAIKCYEKCGFKKEELLIDNIEIDGIFYNDIIMKVSSKNIDHFNNWANTYNESVKKSDDSDMYPFSGYSVIKQKIFDLVTKTEGTKVLEMGIGTGEITYPLYKLGYEIVGVDFSKDMIQKSKEFMPNATFIKNDFISALKDLKDSLFDIIIFNYSIHHLNHINQISLLESLYNKLNSEGVIVIGDVMTSRIKEMEDLRVKYISIWDDEEYYPIYEKYNSKTLSNIYLIKFDKISHCSGIMTLKKEYSINPCRYSALPLYKDIRVNKNTIRVIHETEFKEEILVQYKSHERFFRISHNIKKITKVITPGFSYRVCDINKDIDIILNIINESYLNINIDNNRILNMIEDIVYYPDLWVFIVDESNNKEVALGICHFDKSVGEVELDWIQVLPQYRGRGLGKMLVSYILQNSPDDALFATVSGDVDNPNSPENLYRKCGFKGKDIWHILKK